MLLLLYLGIIYTVGFMSNGSSNISPGQALWHPDISEAN